MYVTGEIPAGAGTIEDVVIIAKSRYSDREAQCKYIQIAIDLIKRDHSDEMIFTETSWRGYYVDITMFHDGGKVYCWWKLYSGSTYLGSGLDRIDSDKSNAVLLFSSTSIVTSPLLPQLM